MVYFLRVFIFKIPLSLLFLSLCGSIFATPLKVTLAIDEEKELNSTIDPVIVQFILSNTSDVPLYILRYEFPDDEIKSDYFSISCNSKAVPYIGVVTYRLGPSIDDWIKINPGGSIIREIDLSASYDMRKTGRYQIRYQAFQHAMYAESENDLPEITVKDIRSMVRYDYSLPENPYLLESNTLKLNIKGSYHSEEQWVDLSPVIPFEVFMINYGECSVNQISDLNRAKGGGYRKISHLLNYLGNFDRDNQFYKKWFGEYSASRFHKVYGNLSKTRNELAHQYHYQCGGQYCTSNVVAYSYPNATNKMWFCDIYWNLNADDKMGVLIHKTTQWRDVARTADLVSGHFSAQDLAMQYPDHAVDNSDTYRQAVQFAP